MRNKIQGGPARKGQTGRDTGKAGKLNMRNKVPARYREQQDCQNTKLSEKSQNNAAQQNREGGKYHNLKDAKGSSNKKWGGEWESVSSESDMKEEYQFPQRVSNRQKWREKDCESERDSEKSWYYKYDRTHTNAEARSNKKRWEERGKPTNIERDNIWRPNVERNQAWNKEWGICSSGTTGVISAEDMYQSKKSPRTRSRQDSNNKGGNQSSQFSCSQGA